eukprot:COSAG06_NODE_36739_length_443_cov_1.005814_1_plen_81_part_01
MGDCTPQCATGMVTGNHTAASCVAFSGHGIYSSALGLWKGMCGECFAVTLAELTLTDPIYLCLRSVLAECADGETLTPKDA